MVGISLFDGIGAAIYNDIPLTNDSIKWEVSKGMCKNTHLINITWPTNSYLKKKEKKECIASHLMLLFGGSTKNLPRIHGFAHFSPSRNIISLRDPTPRNGFSKTSPGSEEGFQTVRSTSCDGPNPPSAMSTSEIIQIVWAKSWNMVDKCM